jgi:hypothetical protein
MFGRADAGISQSTSLIFMSSDIEHHPCAPAHGIVTPELESVQGDRLDELPGLSPMTFDSRAEPTLADLERGDPLRYELLGLAEVDEFAQPLDQQQGRLLRSQLDLARQPRAAAVADQLRDGRERIAEDRRFRRSLELELELGRVLDPAIHAFDYASRKARNAIRLSSAIRAKRIAPTVATTTNGVPEA